MSQHKHHHVPETPPTGHPHQYHQHQRPRQATGTPKKSGKKGVIALVLLVIFVGAGLATFTFMGGWQLLPFSKAPVAYTAQGQLRAMRLAPPTTTDAKEMEAYFDDAISFAKTQGFNTLIFDAKQGIEVWWRDKNFPTVDSVAANDRFMSKADPLALLCQRLEGQEIQLWLELNPFEGGSYNPDSKAKLVKLLTERKQASANIFSAGDTEYTDMLVESLSKLPTKYPVAGYLFSGIDDTLLAQNNANEYAVMLEPLLEELHTGLADNGRLIPLSLVLEQQNTLLTPATGASMVEKGLVRYLLGSFTPNAHLAKNMAGYGVSGLVLQEPQTDTSGYVYFVANRTPSFSGSVLGTWPAIATQANSYAFLPNVLETPDTPLPNGFEIPTLLSVSYPAQNAVITTEGLFIMGTSDPAQPLYFGQDEVTNRAADGLFGVLVQPAVGANSYTFTQGGQTITLNIERKIPTPGAGGELPSDGVAEAKPGQVVRIATTIASALTNPGNMGSINETFPRGAVFIVEESVPTTSGGKKTWAYKLKSGDYVLGANCEWLTDAGTASFTGLTAQPDASGEWLTFEGTGTPAAYVSRGDGEGSLNLTFYDTTLTIPEHFTSRFVSDSSVTQNPDGSVTLKLLTNYFWGYSLEYIDGQTKLYLKAPPQRSQNPLKPLEGVRVMLDPGHGDTDSGTPGVLWSTGPHEKDLNLALAQGIAYRLRQMGAEVLMTRTDDSFPTLQQRLEAQTIQKPDFFISIHHNAMEPVQDLNPVTGTEVYYYHPYELPASEFFANNLINRVAPFTGREARKAAEWSYFYVTRTTVCPSVLFEYGYAMSPMEFGDIASFDGIMAASFATAQGILDSMPDPMADIPTAQGQPEQDMVTPQEPEEINGSLPQTTA